MSPGPVSGSCSRPGAAAFPTLPHPSLCSPPSHAAFCGHRAQPGRAVPGKHRASCAPASGAETLPDRRTPPLSYSSAVPWASLNSLRTRLRKWSSSPVTRRERWAASRSVSSEPAISVRAPLWLHGEVQGLQIDVYYNKKRQKLSKIAGDSF